MNFLKHLNLQTKLFIPSVLLIIIPVTGILVVVKLILDQRFDREKEYLSNEKLAQIEILFDQHMQRSIEITEFIACMQEIQEPLDLFNSDSVDNDIVIKQLTQTFKNISRQYYKNYKKDIKFNIYAPNVQLLYSSWLEENLAQLPFSRKPLLNVNTKQNTVAGIEYLEQGLFIRSIAPIYSQKSRMYKGAIEVFVPLQPVLKSIKSSINDKYAILIKKDIIKRYNEQRLRFIDSSFIFDDVVRLERPATNLIINELHLNEFKQMNIDKRKSTFIFEFRNSYLLFNLFDANNGIVGTILYQVSFGEQISQNNKILIINVFIILIVIGFSSISLYLLIHRQRQKIAQVQKSISKLELGQFPDAFQEHGTDELASIMRSLNIIVSSLQEKLKFSKEIGKGNFASRYIPVSTMDLLGNALLELRQSLRRAADEESKRKIEDDKIKWATEGRSLINEVLRKQYKTIEDISDEVTRTIVKYMDVAQGGLFIVDDSDKENIFLELKGMYAYNKKKHLEKRIDMGEGLIGMCAQEKYTIIKKNIPEDFVKIRSGLGFSNPRNLLVLPLNLDNIVLGVIELASFQEFEKHKVQFLELIAENIASALSNVKITAQTNLLLKQSQQQAEILARHEQEMEEKIAEIELERSKAQDLADQSNAIIKSIDNSILHAEFDTEGNIVYANSIFLEQFKYLLLELEGKHYSIFFDEADKERFVNIWKRLAKGGNYYLNDLRLRLRTDKAWFHCSFSPLKDNENNVYRILLIAFNIDEAKRLSLKRENEIKSYYQSLLIAEYKPDGSVISYNTSLLNLLGYSKLETQYQNLFHTIEKKKEQGFRNMWDSVLDGESIQYLQKVFTKDGREIWLAGVYTAINNYDGFIEKVNFIAVNISDYYLGQKFPFQS